MFLSFVKSNIQNKSNKKATLIKKLLLSLEKHKIQNIDDFTNIVILYEWTNF